MKINDCFKLILVLVVSLPSLSMAWWNDQWNYRVPISLDASPQGANISENLTNVSLLVRLHAGNFQDFFLLKEDLADLRFIAMDDKTPLKHHVEHWDLINQMLFVWVKVPQLTGGISTEKFWMYYGNASAVANEDAAGSFSVDQSLAVHFKANDATPMDETAYKNVIVGSTVSLQPASIIAGGAYLDGSSNIHIADNPALTISPDTGWTFSTWIKPSGAQKDTLIFKKGAGNQHLLLGMDGQYVYAKLATSDGVYETPKSFSMGIDVWQHLALVVKQNEMLIFVNGHSVITLPIKLASIEGDLWVGSNELASNGFVGELDEIGVFKVSQSDVVMQLVNANQAPQDRLLSVQSGEQLGDAGGSDSGFFQVIASSTTESGWTIIAMLGVMGGLSWLVMIGKFIYLRYAVKENRSFLKAYHKLGSKDPAMLDQETSAEDEVLEDSPIASAIFGKHDHFQSSPVYHLYHRGVQELRSRISPSVGAKGVLNQRGIDAIRAALDADMTREAQKLNGQMVLLTIAISGGPFLGLLGTVVGVMITFAAIAATGDVNIAAIAPGVAAALLTTVAGLFVAIPALFGYNYLSARIKETMVDMRVFCDEFVTRLAEYHAS